MDEHKLKEQVELIRQVFEYIHLFKGKIFVFKIECPILNHPYFPLLIKDLVLLHRQGIRIMLVPGSKERIDEILSQYGIQTETVEGTRISTADAIPFIEMASFDVSHRLMTQLSEQNAQAVLGNWVKARGIGVREGIDFQLSGMVERVNVETVQGVLGQGLIPIFPNIGWSSSGQPYNISSNELACALSCSLSAEKLFFIGEGGGLETNRLRVPDEILLSPEGKLTQLSLKEARVLLDRNQEDAACVFLEYLRQGEEACRRGVRRVHILDGSIEGVILKEIFSNRGSGTMIYANQHENIRPMTTADISEVLRVMQPFVERGVLLARREEDLLEHCEDFAVYEVDGMVHACGALYRYPENQGEIAGIAVDETYTGMGIGKRIVSYLLNRACSLKLDRVFALTTQTGDWFQQLGFHKAEVGDLPALRRQHWNPSRNSRVLALDLEGFKAPEFLPAGDPPLG